MSSGDSLSLVHLEGSSRKALSNTVGSSAPGASYLKFCLSKNTLLARWIAMGVFYFLVLFLPRGFDLYFNKNCYLHPTCLLWEINYSRMLLCFAEQGSMWEWNLKKPKSIYFSTWAEMQYWWWCEGASRSDVNGSNVGLAVLCRVAEES